MNNGTIAAGGAASTDHRQRGESNLGTTSAPGKAADSVAQWTGSSPSMESKPGQPVNDDQIPPQDRNLVHDFFKSQRPE